MIAMAVVAGRSHDKPALEQSFSMDTLRIIGQNIMLWNVVDTGNRSAFSVAFAAENRDVHLVGAGIDVAGWKDVVITMTFAASGGIGSPTFQGSAVNSLIKFSKSVILFCIFS